MTQKIGTSGKKAFRRTFNLNRIKRDISYSPYEICELLGVHKNTVHMWLKEGLCRIDKIRPYLIHGSDLYTFLKERQEKRSQPCTPNEIYCMKCRKPQPVWENIVDIIIYNTKKLMLHGLCSFCNSTVKRLGTVSQIDSYQKQFIIQTVGQRHN